MWCRELFLLAKKVTELELGRSLYLHRGCPYSRWVLHSMSEAALQHPPAATPSPAAASSLTTLVDVLLSV